jgi:type IV secretory pathway TraG/TraD family ATPase VirD4
MLNLLKKHRGDITTIMTAITSLLSIWFFVWVWDYIIVSILYTTAPNVWGAFNLLWEITYHYQRFDLLLIGAIYILAIVPIPLAIYLRNRLGVLLLLIPAWFYGSIFTGNVLYTVFIYKIFDFSFFYPFQVIYSNYYKDFYDWFILGVCYILPMVILSAGIAKFLWIESKKEKKEHYGGAKFADKKSLNKLDLVHSTSKALKEGYNMHTIGKLQNNYLGPRMITDMITVGKKGSGKGVTGSMPTLLELMVNCFTNDIKGELFMVSYKERIKNGKRPIALDVMRILDKYHDFSDNVCIRFNPLWTKLLEDATLADKTRYLDAITSSLIMDKGNAKDDHWTGKSRTVLRGFLTIVIEYNISQHQDLKKALIKIDDSKV